MESHLTQKILLPLYTSFFTHSFLPHGRSVGEKWMRGKRTPKDVCGEAIHLLYGAVLESKVRSHFIIIHLYASDLVCAPKLLHNLCLFGCLFFNQSGYITADITVFRTWKRIFEGQTIKGDRARDVQKWAHKILWFRMFRLSWKND